MSDKKQEAYQIEKRYYSDIPADLPAVFLRATIYCGEILSVAVPDLPEGYNFFSAENIPGENKVLISDTEVHLFAEKRVDFFGQPIGILVGEDKFVLQSLLHEFKIQYKEDNLTYFPTMDGTIGPLFDNEAFSFPTDGISLQNKKSSGDETALNEALKEENEYFYSLKLPEDLTERIGCIAAYKKGTLHIYAPIRWLALTMELIERATGLPSKKIIIHSTVCHNLPSNAIFEIPILCSQIAVGALKTKGTVKFESSSFEHSTFFARPTNAILGIKSAIDEKGKIAAMKMRLVVDAGHFNPCINTILSRTILDSCGCFEIPNYCIEFFTQTTNFASSDASPDGISSLVTMALNRHFHEKTSSADRENFFLKNAISAIHKEMEDEKLPEIFNQVLSRSDFRRKNSAYGNIVATGDLSLPTRGISLAVGFENSGGFENSEVKKFYTMEVTLTADNNVVIKFHRIRDGIKLAWQKIVADFFNLSPSQILFDETFSDKGFSLTCEIFSRDLAITTQLLLKCCAAIKKSRFINPLPIRVKKSFSAGSKTFFSTAWCVAVCEVELDTILLEPKLRRVWLGIDAGNVFDEEDFKKKIALQAKRLFKHFLQQDGHQSPELEIFVHPFGSSEKCKDASMLIDGVISAAICNAFCEALNVQIRSIPLSTGEILMKKFDIKDEVSTENSGEVVSEKKEA